MVAAKHPLICKAGIDVMRKGGNAVDAAVAAAFMDCVVEPAMNGIGGEGVMAIHTADGRSTVIDYVGRPSKNCTPDMYELLDEVEPGWMGWKRVKDDANVVGYKASTTPGTVAGLAKALEMHGTMELKELIEPAAKVAEGGFIVGWWTASHYTTTMETFSRFPAWRKIFLKDGKYPPRPYSHALRKNPDLIVNKDLAKSLRLIAKGGPDAFYKGEIAEAIARDMEKNDGLITAEDLAMYEPIVWDKPTPGTYRGYDVIYDPSHAGTTVMEILNILEGFDLAGYGFGSMEHLHVMAEAIGLAYADRFEYMGDPGFIDVPQRGMTSKEYAKALQKKINFKKALKIAPGDPRPYEETTALTAADKDGNAVAINQTIVNTFGSGVVIPGTGILLNNAMYGLNPEPGTANSIDGRKRRIQNVCPVLLLKDGKAYMSVGAPGGRAIQTSVLQTIVHVVDFGMDPQSAIEAPRITREVGETQVDNRFPREAVDRLEKMGHQIAYLDKELGSWARPVCIIADPKTKMLHGGTEWHFVGFESEAIGY